ncbi:hypothetical protein D3C80_1709410 [compost metagenome]
MIPGSDNNLFDSDISICPGGHQNKRIFNSLSILIKMMMPDRHRKRRLKNLAQRFNQIIIFKDSINRFFINDFHIFNSIR